MARNEKELTVGEMRSLGHDIIAQMIGAYGELTMTADMFPEGSRLWGRLWKTSRLIEKAGKIVDAIQKITHSEISHPERLDKCQTKAKKAMELLGRASGEINSLLKVPELRSKPLALRNVSWAFDFNKNTITMTSSFANKRMYEQKSRRIDLVRFVEKFIAGGPFINRRTGKPVNVVLSKPREPVYVMARPTDLSRIIVTNVTDFLEHQRGDLRISIRLGRGANPKIHWDFSSPKGRPFSRMARKYIGREPYTTSRGEFRGEGKAGAGQIARERLGGDLNALNLQRGGRKIPVLRVRVARA